MSLLKKLFSNGKKESEQAADEQAQEKAMKIISVYSRILEYLPGTVIAIDDTKLPYPKQEIKIALLAGMWHFNTLDFKAAYLKLAHWQPNVGDNDIFQFPIDRSNIPLETDPDFETKVRSLAAKMYEKQDVRAYWNDIVTREARDLQLEFDGFFMRRVDRR